MDVALVSCVKPPEPDPDEKTLSGALAAAGISAKVLAWDDPGVAWSDARLIVLRSAWNYPLNPKGFLSWAERAAAASDLWNPLPVVRCNIHKRYLIDLQRKGIPTAPTVLVPRDSTIALDAILSQRDWTHAVLKPAISAASFRTVCVGPGDGEVGEKHLRFLVENGDALVQEYLPAVETDGERALVWIDGELTHAVRKTARFAGEDEKISPAVPILPAEAALAHRVLRAVKGPLLYARVDMTLGADELPVVMELELIEPSLFLSHCPRALERFVGAVRERLDRRPRP